MAAWEYGYIWVQSGRRGVMMLGGGESQSLGLVGGGQDVLALLNQVGADGWELVGPEVHSEGTGLGHTVFWLKREPPAAPS